MFKRFGLLFDAAKVEGSDGGGGEKPPESKVISINSAVEDAATKVGDNGEGTEKKTELDTKKDDKKEKSEEKKSQEVTLTPEQEVQARQLFTALGDPDKSPIIIKFLAEKAGYTKPIETKQEAKEAKDIVLESLKESLGEEYGFLADKFAPAISKIIDAKLKENTKDIRDRLDEQEVTKLRNAADLKQSELAKEYFDTNTLPDEILEAMTKEMDRVSPSKDMTTAEYVEHIFFSIAGKQKLLPKVKGKEDKINRNRNDVISSLASYGTKQPVPVSVGSKKMSLDEALRTAVEELEKQQQ